MHGSLRALTATWLNRLTPGDRNHAILVLTRVSTAVNRKYNIILLLMVNVDSNVALNLNVAIHLTTENTIAVDRQSPRVAQTFGRPLRNL